MVGSPPCLLVELGHSLVLGQKWVVLARAGSHAVRAQPVWARRQRWCLSREGQWKVNAEAVSQPRRQWKVKAEAVSQPRRQWKHKAKAVSYRWARSLASRALPVSFSSSRWEEEGAPGVSFSTLSSPQHRAAAHTSPQQPTTYTHTTQKTTQTHAHKYLQHSRNAMLRGGADLDTAVEPHPLGQLHRRLLRLVRR